MPATSMMLARLRTMQIIPLHAWQTCVRQIHIYALYVHFDPASFSHGTACPYQACLETAMQPASRSHSPVSVSCSQGCTGKLLLLLRPRTMRRLLVQGARGSDYVVTLADKGHSCECMSFRMRRGICKHIRYECTLAACNPCRGR